MKYVFALLTILLALPLLSVAPVPPVLPLAIVVPHPVTTTRVIPIVQICNEQRARELSGPYLREVISDARGIPIGEVAAWSCVGDVAATIAEFDRRKAAMIGGTR